MNERQFLLHFYQIINLYLQEEDSLSKVFSLYIVRSNNSQQKAEEFRNQYVGLFERLLTKENEVNFLFEFLEQDEKESLRFLLKAK